MNCSTIDKLLEIAAKGSFGSDDSTIVLVLKYTKNPDGGLSKPQEYVYPTTPGEVLKIMGELLKHGLIEVNVLEGIGKEFGKLREGLISRLDYKYLF